MDLSSLNVDVLFYLIKFVKPVDRFNLVLSGVLKGFENANIGIDLRKRIVKIEIELGPCRDGTCQLEIRSLEYRGYTGLNDVSSLITLERLADGAYLENNRQMYLDRWVSSIPRLFRVICSMTNLEKLHFFNCNLTDTALKDLACVFQSCPKLTELHLILFRSLKLEMNGDLKKDLRPGFQRLRVFELHFGIDSWLVMQEIFTWLKECSQLRVRIQDLMHEIDGSLTLNPDFAKNLRDLCLWRFPVEFVKWLLPFCPNIHTLKLHILGCQPKALKDEIARLEKLKDLHFGYGIYPKEIIRNCPQVGILRLDGSKFSLEDMADLEHNENITEIHITWLRDLPTAEFLPMLKRCTHLRRLTFKSGEWPPFPPFEELRDLIIQLKHLTFLHIISVHSSHCDHFKSEVDEVKAFVLPRRPNFTFYLSCCDILNESRVSTTPKL